MDPFSIFWLCSGFLLFMGATAFAVQEQEPEIVLMGLVLAGGAPLFIGLAILFGIIYLPYVIMNAVARHRERKALKFQNLDAELDKHIEETRQLTRK